MPVKLFFFRSRALLCLASALLLLCSCHAPSEGGEPAGGPGIIIPGESMEGVKLGDSREEVEELLGTPYNIGWGDGYRRAWRIYQYKPSGTEGPGLEILFIDQMGDDPWGPVDMLSAFKPYEGKTPEGIGIGSSLQEVLNAYGEPDFASEGILNNGKGTAIYCYDSIKFELGISDYNVRLISINHYIPLEEDRFCPPN